MPQRTLTLDALIALLEALCEQYGGETPVYIDDADTEYSLGIACVEYETRNSYGGGLPPGIYLSGAYDTEEV